MKLSHKFVKNIPEDIEERTVYVSVDYAMAIHNCCCGCGSQVVTPLSPTDWKLTFDGETISLHPSIGNWNFACQSHYWIKTNKVHWAPKWSREQIENNRKSDERNKNAYYNKKRRSIFDFFFKK